MTLLVGGTERKGFPEEGERHNQAFRLSLPWPLQEGRVWMLLWLDECPQSPRAKAWAPRVVLFRAKPLGGGALWEVSR